MNSPFVICALSFFMKKKTKNTYNVILAVIVCTIMCQGGIMNIIVYLYLYMY